MQVIEPTDRIGARDARPYSSIRNHAFFEGVDFESLYLATPPSIQEFIPESSRRPDPCWSRLKNQEAGADRLNRLMLEDGGAHSDEDEDHRTVTEKTMMGEAKRSKNIVNLTDEERQAHLDEQGKSNKFHRFVEGNLIIKQGKDSEICSFSNLKALFSQAFLTRRKACGPDGECSC